MSVSTRKQMKRCASCVQSAHVSTFCTSKHTNMARMGDTPAQIAESKYILVGGANPEGCLKDNPFGGRKKTGKIIIVFNANSIGIGAQCLAGIGKAAAQTDVDQCTLLSLKEQQQLGRNYEEYAQHTSKEGGEHTWVLTQTRNNNNVTILSHLNQFLNLILFLMRHTVEFQWGSSHSKLHTTKLAGIWGPDVMMYRTGTTRINQAVEIPPSASALAYNNANTSSGSIVKHSF